MAEIVMPRLSDTMEEGTILRWLKSDGDEIARGEELVEIETDKATMIYESDQAGVLRLIAAEGETLAVGAPIATVGDEAPAAGVPGGGIDAGGETVGARPAGGGEVATPEMARPDTEAPAAPGGASEPAAGERVKASPLARRIARERGIDLTGVSGSGPGGRIVKADVQQSAPAHGAAPAGAPGQAVPAQPQEAPDQAGPAPAAAPATSAATAPVAGLEGVATAKGQTTEVQLTKAQQTVARRMAESKATIPDFTLTVDVDMEACVDLRAQLKEIAREGAEVPPTYNDMVVKACALALREHPTANGSYRDGRVQLHSRVNVGVAVAAQDALVVPTVFDADVKALGEIARETRALAERVRVATITPPELGGGTFTVSNLGMYGMRSFTAIVNPPQAAILSVGALEQRAVVRDGALVARHTMTIVLACDHRILYGADAAGFLARVREILESPSALTL